MHKIIFLSHLAPEVPVPQQRWVLLVSLSSTAPEAPNSWKTSPLKGKEAKSAGQFQPGGELAYASHQ